MFGSWFTSTNSAQVVSTELGCNNNINSDSQQSQHNATDKSCDRMKRLRLKNNEYDKQKRSQSKVMHKSLQTENSELKYEIIRLRQRCSEQQFTISNSKMFIKFLLSLVFRLQPNFRLHAGKFLEIVENMFTRFGEVGEENQTREAAANVFNNEKIIRPMKPPIWWHEF